MRWARIDCRRRSLILVIDNFDSFVFNLARYCTRLGHQVEVVRNDALTVDQILSQPPKAIVLSPGPCAPDQAGISLELVRRAAGKIPMLGVCLGHQTIAQAFGADIVRSPEPMHGQWDWIEHQGTGEFQGLPNPMPVGRYHSLVAAQRPWPQELRVTARTQSGIIMAIEHVEHPIIGWQFHPESILTPFGYSLLAAAFQRMGVTSSTSQERAFDPQKLWELEAGEAARADLGQDALLDRPASAFGGTWRDIGEPFVQAPSSESDESSPPPFPLPRARRSP